MDGCFWLCGCEIICVVVYVFGVGPESQSYAEKVRGVVLARSESQGSVEFSRGDVLSRVAVTVSEYVAPCPGSFTSIPATRLAQ